MLGCTTMNTAYEEIISANTVVRYDICPFNKLFVNLMPQTQW